MATTAVACVLGSMLLALAFLVGGSPSRAWADGTDRDFTMLSLEELMNVDVLSDNVLGFHTHRAGEFMFAYEFTTMNMDGNRDGTSGVSVGKVLDDFMVAPTSLTMDMHMFSVMWAPTDELTLMAMLPYIRLSMDHVTRMGGRFTTKAAGIGDFKARGSYSLWGDPGDPHRFVAEFGVSFPTGSINEKDATPMGPRSPLPYPMQLGSGTYDLLPGVVYLGEWGRWSWGTEVQGVVRLAENGRDYRLGNRWALNGWLTRGVTDWMALSVRLTGERWGNIQGRDSRLNPLVVPTADPKLRGGERLDIAPGILLYVPSGMLEGIRVGVEVGVPIYQRLDGPQLETDYIVNVAFSYTFTF